MTNRAYTIWAVKEPSKRQYKPKPNTLLKTPGDNSYVLFCKNIVLVNTQNNESFQSN